MTDMTVDISACASKLMRAQSELEFERMHEIRLECKGHKRLRKSVELVKVGKRAG